MIETVYALYLVITIALTIWVARTLSRNGIVFLTQCFGQNATLANSTNHLLVVGFYLINIGFITLTLSLGREPTTIPEAIRFLSSKVGLAVIVLGAMHFFNMGAIAQFGRKVNQWLSDGQRPVTA
ncbi:hypothetical protein [Sphingomonas sp. LT1P40]|uniref:hypothetical protein n=1 Tax=Alteristakelama amylovorans TaxID=3096166 RepID=UPI002FC5CF11